MQEENELLNKVEAVLFISARFVSLNELVMLTNINPITLAELLKKLQQEYDSENSALLIINKDNLWKMDVRQEYQNIVTRLASGKPEFTRSEQETLAIIAYKQPIKQSVIIKIRGNKAYDEIKRFVEMDLLKAKKAGHTLELQLSEQFYDYFQLSKKENKEREESQEKEESQKMEESQETEAEEKERQQ